MNTFSIYRGLLLLPLITQLHSYPTNPVFSFPVSLYTGIGYSGHNVNVTVDGCVPLKQYPQLEDGLMSVLTHGGCINLYNSIDCGGTYFIAKPGVHALYNLHYLLGDYPSNQIRSIGPCHEVCHPATIDLLANSQTQPVVTLLNHVDSKETKQLITLEKNRCHPIPREKKDSITSISFNPDICVEIYERPNCKGDSQAFTHNSGSIVQDLGGRWQKFSHSISLCGYNCIKKEGDLILPEIESDELEATTVYSTMMKSVNDDDYEDYDAIIPQLHNPKENLAG